MRQIKIQTLPTICAASKTMQAFHLNAENFSDMHAELEPQLSTLKITQKDILNAELLVEEIFLRMINLGKCEEEIQCKLFI